MKEKIFDQIFKHLDKVEVILINDIITGSSNLSHLPKFDLCLTGNHKVIETMVSNGLQCSIFRKKYWNWIFRN